VLITFLRRESTHHDNLRLLSYKTLTALCLHAGFNAFEWLFPLLSFGYMHTCR